MLATLPNWQTVKLNGLLSAGQGEGMNDSSLIATLVDLVIAITLIEGVALLLIHRATGRGVLPREFLLNMVSGLCLMLALRALVRDTGTAWVALCLLSAGLAHGTDLWQRWRRDARSGELMRP